MRFPTRPPNPSFVPFFYYLFGAFPPTVSAPDRARPELRKEAKKKAQGLGKKRKQGASSPRLKEGAHPPPARAPPPPPPHRAPTHQPTDRPTGPSPPPHNAG